MDRYSPHINPAHHPHLDQQQQQQQGEQAAGPVEWLVVTSRQDVGYVSSDAAVSVASTSTALDGAPPAEYSEAGMGTGKSAHVVSEVVKDERCQEETYDITQPSCPPVSG